MVLKDPETRVLRGRAIGPLLNSAYRTVVWSNGAMMEIDPLVTSRPNPRNLHRIQPGTG